MVRVRAVLLGVLLLGAPAACAEPGTASSGVGGTSSAAGSAVPRAAVQAEVVALRAGSDDTHLVVTVAVLAGGSGCGLDPRATVQQEGGTVYLTTVQDAPVSPDPGACPGTQERELVVTVPPLAGVRLQVNGLDEWGPTGADELRRCEPPFGCAPPPADHCDPAYLSVLTTQDLLPNARATVLSCDQQWLVVDVDAAPDDCARPEGAPAPTGCADLVREVRWFARFDGAVPGWQVVASGRAAGCADVEAAGADVPLVLCTGLPAR